MESGSTSYCVYTPGNISPSRPPLRRAAPEHARSGFPFLIGMAALVLAVGIGSVARFCPQDLRFETGRHPAKSTPTTAAITAAITADAKPVDPAPTAPVITPTAFTTINAPAKTPVTAPATTTAKKKSAHGPRSGARSAASSPSASASAAASAASSAAPALPENPYPQASPPETYGF